MFIDLTIKGTCCMSCQPSIITCRRRYTRVCKVRVAQCVHIAQSGSRSRQTSIEQATIMIFVLGCEAPSVPGAFGVYGCAWCTWEAACTSTSFGYDLIGIPQKCGTLALRKLATIYAPKTEAAETIATRNYDDQLRVLSKEMPLPELPRL